MRRFWARSSEWLASLSLAVTLLAMLAAVLAAGTFAESRLGTKAAQTLVYRTWWFSVLLGMLGVNLTMAALSRRPWKRKHTGFVITHAGILLILAGSVVTQQFGVEGQVTLTEGRETDTMLVDRQVLTVAARGGRRTVPANLADLARGKEGPSAVLDGLRVRVEGYAPDTEAMAVVEPASLKEGAPAALVVLSNPRLGVRAEEWLSLGPHGRREYHLGPAVVRLVHERASPDLSGNVLELVIPSSSRGALSYQIASRKGERRSGTVQVGRGYPTPWMPGMSFEVVRYLPAATLQWRTRPRPVPRMDGEEAVPGLKITVEGSPSAEGWVALGETARFHAGGDLVEVYAGDEVRPLGFTVYLKDFKVGRYPGTNRPASFESEVEVRGAPGAGPARIFMNHPLVYRGWRLFQSSYIEVPPGQPEISVLSAARDPGLGMKYAGCILLVGGIACMFYLRPLSRKPEEAA